MGGLCEHGYEHGYRGWVHTADGWRPTGYPASFFGPIPLPPPLSVRVRLAVRRFLSRQPYAEPSFPNGQRPSRTSAWSARRQAWHTYRW